MLYFMCQRLAKRNNSRAIQTTLSVTIVSFVISFFTIHAYAAASVTLDQLRKDEYKCEDLGTNKEQVKCSKTYYCLLSNGVCAPKPID